MGATDYDYSDAPDDAVGVAPSPADAPAGSVAAGTREFAATPEAAEVEDADRGTFAGLSDKRWLLGTILSLISALTLCCCCYFCLWPLCFGGKTDDEEEEQEADLQAYPTEPHRHRVVETSVDQVARVPNAGVPLAAGVAASGGAAYAAAGRRRPAVDPARTIMPTETYSVPVAPESVEQPVIIPTEAKNLPPYTLVTPVETRRTREGATMVTPVQTRQVDGGMAINPVEAMSVDSNTLVTPVETRVEGGRTVVYPIGMQTVDGRDIGAQVLTGTTESVTAALR